MTTLEPHDQTDNVDFLIVGSGFGGSISAYRLAQKGYRVLVLEAGKRWEDRDFPESNWNLRKYLWAPRFRFFGPQKITLLKGVMILHGCGVGGGSLVYANTLMKPREKVFSDWPGENSWNEELSPFYERALRMLGGQENPCLGEGEALLKEVAQEAGVGQSFHPTRVGVFFGEPGKTVKDPYFGGKGPDRTGCLFCGACMVGCRHGAKNSLPKNYLYLAESLGARVVSETKVEKIVPDRSGYRVESSSSTAWWGSKRKVTYARKVILSAGVLGTVEILLKNRDEFKSLPGVSDKLGDWVRTNGESLTGATSFDAHRTLSRGIAIGASFDLNAQTRVEGVRYPSGSSLMKFLAVPLTANGSRLTRPLKLILRIFRRLPSVLRLWTLRDWASRSMIILIMQSVDQKMRLRLGRSLLSPFRKSLQGSYGLQPPRPFMEDAQRITESLASKMNGEPQNALSEVLLATPATAHILGGACMGESRESGVVGFDHEVYGYPGLFVCDGSVIPVNLGVNPSLTISALAERFTEQFETRKVADSEFLERADNSFA